MLGKTTFATLEISMTTLPITYGYARVSKTDDDSRNLETQLRLLADHGIREDLIFSDIATGRTLRRGRLAGSGVPSPARRYPGGGLPGPVEPELRRRSAHPG